MKKNIIYSGLILALVFLLNGCDTNENLVQQRGVAVVPNLESLMAMFFTDDFDNSPIRLSAALPDGERVDAAELRVSFRRHWTVVVDGEEEVVYEDMTAAIQSISSFPFTVELTAREAMNALGITDADMNVERNNAFTFYVTTTSNGVTTRSRTGTVRYLFDPAFCDFNPALTEGRYRIVSGAWGMDDYVTLAADPNDRYRILVSGIFEAEGGTPNNNVMELNIDRFSFAVSGPRSTLGAYVPWNPGAGWGQLHWQPLSGIYRSCTGAFELQIRITVDAGAFGNFSFVLTRAE